VKVFPPETIRNVALVGHNGSGKTTTFKLMLGLIYPDRGSVSLWGEPANSPESKSRIGFLPENPYFYSYLTAAESLDFYGRLFGLAKKQRRERVHELLATVGLEHARNRQLRKFSRGMLQRVGIAQALIKNLSTDLNIKPRFVVVNPIELIPLIAEGEIQMAPGLSHKIGWEQAIDFSVTYFVAGTGVAVSRGSSIRKIRHLKRKKIALPSSISNKMADDMFSKMIPGVEFVSTKNVFSGFELLKERKVVGVYGNIRDLLNCISREDEEKPGSFIVIEESISKTPCAVGVPPTDARWREMIDFSMMKIFESGEYGKIYEKWFGKDSQTKYSPGFTMEIWPK